MNIENNAHRCQNCVHTLLLGAELGRGSPATPALQTESLLAAPARAPAAQLRAVGGGVDVGPPAAAPRHEPRAIYLLQSPPIGHQGNILRPGNTTPYFIFNNSGIKYLHVYCVQF